MTEGTEKHYSTCTLCEAMCGIEVTTKDNTILSISGDRNNPFSQGYSCPKAGALKDIHEDPDRVKTPLKKVDGQWQTISWDQAFEEVAQQIHALQSEHGKDAVGVYLGNPNAHNMGAILFGPYFYRLLGSNNRYSATSVDQLPHHIISRYLFGHQLQIPIPDVDRCDTMIIIGGNPLVSNGSIMTIPNVRKRLKGIQQRGGKIVVVDPRRTETAELADQHHFIRPGTDAWLVLSMLNVMFANQWEKTDALQEHIESLDQQQAYIRKMVSPFTPELAESKTGIPAETITELTRIYCASKAAVCYGRMGASVQAFGTLTQYLIMLLNIFSGNLNKEGGMMFTQPAADTLPHSGRGSVGKSRSRVRDLPGFAGELPVSALAEEILTPGEGQIRGMILGAGNPVLTTPNGEQLDGAFEQLDLVVAVDFYINETNRHANYILPPVMSLERDHYDVVFHKFAVRNYVTFASPAVTPPEGAMADWEIYLSLSKALATCRGEDATAFDALFDKTPTGVVDDMLRASRYREQDLSVNKLKSHPHGIDLGPLQPELPGAVFHENKKIQLCAETFLSDLERLNDSAPAAEDGQLLLIGRRHLKSNNSWLHNSARMLKGNNRCVAMLHPSDAERFGIEDEQSISLRSRVGEISVEVQVTDEIMPGVVSVPHGWGHDKAGTCWQVAADSPGSNVNNLSDELLLDEFSGNAVLNGIPVSIA